MASLDDFTTGSNVTLDDFQIEGPLVQIKNEPSTKNLAAYTAALSPDAESVEATYLQSVADHDLEGSSALSNQVVANANEEAYTHNREALVDFLADPSVSDEEKRVAANSVLDRTNELYNIRNIVSTEALIAESGPDETVESEDARVDVAFAIEEVNAFKREQQARLNAELNKEDPNVLKTAYDIAEMLLPFTEGENTGAIVSGLKDGDKGAYLKAVALMGSSKEELTQMLSKLPPSERGLMTERVIDLINSSPGVALADNNDYARADLLRTALEDGYYTETSKWVDNIVSLLDMSMIGGVIGRGVRAARRASRTLREGEAVEEGASIRNVSEEEAEAAWKRHAQENDLSAAEDASETTIAIRRDRMEGDPVRRQENYAESRAEARGAIQREDDSLARMEESYERRSTTRRTGGNAANLSDSALRAAEDEAIQKAMVRSRVSPVSLSQNYKDTNPAKARAANELAGDSEEGAQALYGTNRTEAVAHDELPEISRTNGSVKNKVSMPDRAPKKASPANPRVMDYADKNGAIYLTDAEKASAATRVVHDFNNAMGLTTRKEMVMPKVGEIGGKVDVEVVYGPRDMGWTSAQDGIDLVRSSLRDYGVKESDITLLRKQGEDYVPVSKDVADRGDYLVKVNYPYKLAADDVSEWTDLDVKNNFFDRMPHWRGAKGGSLARMLLDPASMLHPTIYKAANQAVDKAAGLEKILLDQIQEFSIPFKNLSSERKALIESVIKKNNKEGKFPTKNDMISQGLSQIEQGILKSWRAAWDTIFWLENSDLVKSLRNGGYGVIEDASTYSRLFAKQVPRNQAGQYKRVYDLELGRMRTLEADEATRLYEQGGAVARLKAPFRSGDEAAEAVIVKNQPGGSFLRRLRDDDQVLNYREGYYTVYYDAPQFVVKVERASDGTKLYERAVATAGDMKSAELMARRLAATDGGEYFTRGDVKKMQLESNQNWELQVAQGRTAQRVRGERLEDATSPITAAEDNHILGPVDSLITSVKSVSTRVSMRNFLDATKTRAIEQYGEVFPKNKYGNPTFPSSSKEIIAPGREASELAADARTTVEYIKFLEDGYINSMDEGIKNILRGVADLLGSSGFTAGERVARRASEARGITSAGRSLTFTLYLALSPLRQFVVQAHQSVQLFAIEPVYVAKNLVRDVAGMQAARAAINSRFLSTGVKDSSLNIASKLAGRSEDELVEMYRLYEESGLAASIDKQNLVRESLTEIAENSRIAGRNNVLAKGVAGVRKVGFDEGENINMMSAWLAFYNAAKRNKKGKALSQTDLERVAADARDYTYNMNRAGDMPYNQNALGLVFQFMQVPHKALLQMTFSRSLTPAQKARLITFNSLMYGAVPGSTLYYLTSDWLPEDGEIREVALQGVESYMFNKLLSLAFQEESDIDFSGLAAADMTGLYEFVTNLLTTDAGEIVAATPAGSLFMGSSPRISQFAKDVAEYMRFTEPADLTPIETSEVFKSFASLSSGASNFFKARAMAEYEKRYNSQGGIVDPNVSTPEALARLFGFGTLAEARRYYVSSKVYENNKKFKEDVTEAYKTFKKAVAREGITNEEREFGIRALNWSWKVFEDSPEARRIIRQQIKYDIQNQDMSLIRSAIRSHGMDNEQTRDLFRNMPISEEQRGRAMQLLDHIDSYRDEE